MIAISKVILCLSLSHLPMRRGGTHESKITINCSSRVPYHLKNLHSGHTPAKVLFKAVERVAGIPSNKQMLFYKKEAINPNSSLRIDNGSFIDLIVKGCGGGGETDAGVCLHLLLS